MNPLVGLVLSVATLFILMLAVGLSEVSPGLKIAFVLLAAPGIALAVMRYRERR
ncbi:MAG: hypothetical protein M3P39_04070 [Actinomycetota bacterium]|jgi:hypothetical protein|nr:hypothetical protein [Actinomycetota bacterium]